MKKRSDVVLELSFEIERLHNRYGNLIYNFKDTADKLLESMEDLGMVMDNTPDDWDGCSVECETKLGWGKEDE